MMKLEKVDSVSMLSERDGQMRRFLRLTVLESEAEPEMVGTVFWYIMHSKGWAVVGNPMQDEEAEKLEEEYLKEATA